MKKWHNPLISLVLIAIVVSISAQVPRTMNYQGKLTDSGGVAVGGPVEIVFRIYDDEVAGSLLWEEAHVGVDAIGVANGLFDVILGELVALDLAFDEEYWVELEIEGEILAPREKLSSVAYAHRAVYADTAGYVIGGGGADNDWTRAGNIVHAFNTTDTIGIGTTSPSGGKLVVLDNTEGTGIHLEAEPPTIDGTVRNSPKLSFTNSYRFGGSPLTHTSSIYTSSPSAGHNRLLNFDNGLTKFTMNSSEVEFEFKGDFQNWPNLDMIFLAPRVTSGYGYGTDVVLDMRGQYWNGSASVERSAKITHEVENDGISSMRFKIQGDATRMTILSGGNVGIGTATPAAKLDINGTTRMTGFNMPTSAVNGYVLTTDASGNGTWQASGGGGGIGGSGTNGRIARFTPDGTTLGNSTFRDDGTTVGLNAAQTSANMLYIQDDRVTSAKQGLYVDSYTSNTGTGDIVGLLAKARVTASGSHNAAGIIGMVDGNNMNWAVGVMAVNKSGSTTPVVPSVLTALYADGSNNWAWSGWFTGGHVAISRATAAQTGELHFHDLDGTALANYVGFKAPTALSSNYVYTLPSSYPASSGQVLSSTTAGVLSWATVGGSGDYIQNQTATNQSANFRIDGHGYFYGDATSYIDIYASSSDQNIVSTDQMIIVSAEGIKLRGPYTQVQTSTAVPYVQFDGTNQRMGIGTTSPSYNLHVAGSARVNSLNINGAYSLPTSAGTTSQYLRGDGTWGTPSTGGSGWSLTGNAGTTPGTNFVGTTDGQALVFKTSNSERVRITSGGDVAIGNFTNPEAMLEIRETIADIYVRAFNDYSWQDGGRLALQRMGGSQTSPTATPIDYGIGVLDFRGGYGTSVSGVTAASIKSVSPVTWVSASNTRGGDLRFYTINISGSQSIYDNERMRIGSLGGVGININPTPSTTTNYDPTAYMHVYGGIGIGPVNNSISLAHGQQNSIQIASDNYYGGTNDNHSGYLIYSIMPGGWGTGELHFACATDWGVYNTTTPALRVTQTGIYVNGTYYSSDRRIKSDFRKMPYGLEQVMAMEPLYYSKHIAKDMADGKPVLGESAEEIGFIAQDIYKILPEVVSKPQDESSELWAIDYAKIVPVLVKAIQQQQTQIETDSERIQSLERTVELQEELIKMLSERIGKLESPIND